MLRIIRQIFSNPNLFNHWRGYIWTWWIESWPPGTWMIIFWLGFLVRGLLCHTLRRLDTRHAKIPGKYSWNIKLVFTEYGMIYEWVNCLILYTLYLYQMKQIAYVGKTLSPNYLDLDISKSILFKHTDINIGGFTDCIYKFE